MKVILLTEIKSLGKANQVVEVSDGYAKNYLFAKKLAIPATTTALANNKKFLDEEKKLGLEKLKYYQKVKQDLEGFTLEFKLTSHKDKVAGAISAKQICAYLLHNYQIEIDKHKFIGFKPINKLGSNQVSVRLYDNIIANFNVEIKPA